MQQKELEEAVQKFAKILEYAYDNLAIYEEDIKKLRQDFKEKFENLNKDSPKSSVANSRFDPKKLNQVFRQKS